MGTGMLRFTANDIGPDGVPGFVQMVVDKLDAGRVEAERERDDLQLENQRLLDESRKVRRELRIRADRMGVQYDRVGTLEFLDGLAKERDDARRERDKYAALVDELRARVISEQEELARINAKLDRALKLNASLQGERRELKAEVEANKEHAAINAAAAARLRELDPGMPHESLPATVETVRKLWALLTKEVERLTKLDAAMIDCNEQHARKEREANRRILELELERGANIVHFVSQLAQRSHAAAVKHGQVKAEYATQATLIHATLAKLKDERTELWAELGKGELRPCDENGNPCGVAEEAIDNIFVHLTMLHGLGYDVGPLLMKKLQINEQRAVRGE